MSRILLLFSDQDRTSVSPIANVLRADGHILFTNEPHNDLPDACLWFISQRSLSNKRLLKKIGTYKQGNVLFLPILLDPIDVKTIELSIKLTSRPIDFMRPDQLAFAIQELRSRLLETDSHVVSTKQQRSKGCTGTILLAGIIPLLMACALVLLLNRNDIRIPLLSLNPTLTEVSVSPTQTPSPTPTATRKATVTLSVLPTTTTLPSSQPTSTSSASATITDTPTPLQTPLSQETSNA